MIDKKTAERVAKVKKKLSFLGNDFLAETIATDLVILDNEVYFYECQKNKIKVNSIDSASDSFFLYGLYLSLVIERMIKILSLPFEQLDNLRDINDLNMFIFLNKIDLVKSELNDGTRFIDQIKNRVIALHPKFKDVENSEKLKVIDE